MPRLSTQDKILQYLYTVDSVPRKQLKLANQDVAYNTVARAVRKLLDLGYVELTKAPRKASRIRITKAGIAYLTKAEILPKEEKNNDAKQRVRSVVTTPRKKGRIERVKKTVDLCKAAEISISGIDTGITFDCFSSKAQEDDIVDEFSTVFVENALFFRADEITKAIKQSDTYGEEVTKTQSRFTGVIINKNGLWVVYHTLDGLMRYTKSVESTILAALISYLKHSWMVRQYPDFFKYLNVKPVAIVIGDTPSMLPKIYTGRKWGELESDSQSKQHAATQLISYSNLLQTYRDVEFIPNSEIGRNYLHRVVCMTQAQVFIMCREWAETHGLNCAAINNLYQVEDGRRAMVILPSIGLNMIERLRNIAAPTSIVVERGMAESVSRVLGPSLRHAYNYDLEPVKVNHYNYSGVRVNGINPLTKKGHLK